MVFEVPGSFHAPRYAQTHACGISILGQRPQITEESVLAHKYCLKRLFELP